MGRLPGGGFAPGLELKHLLLWTELKHGPTLDESGGTGAPNATHRVWEPDSPSE
jgi:hypothetical protein